MALGPILCGCLLNQSHPYMRNGWAFASAFVCVMRLCAVRRVRVYAHWPRPTSTHTSACRKHKRRRRRCRWPMCQCIGAPTHAKTCSAWLSTCCHLLMKLDNDGIGASILVSVCLQCSRFLFQMRMARLSTGCN